MSTIRANSITNAAGTGAPDFPNGLTDNTNSVLNTSSALPAGNLTGTLPALNGAALTNLPAPTVLLGTINTTSGTTQTISGLTLTDYKFLLLMVNGISNGSGGTFYLTSGLAARTFATSSGGGVEVSGNILIDLSTGVFSSSCGASSGTPSSNYGGLSGISSASTSVSVLSSVTFDLGSIKVYGVK